MGQTVNRKTLLKHSAYGPCYRKINSAPTTDRETVWRRAVRSFSITISQHHSIFPNKNCGAFGTAVFLIFLLPRPAALSQGCTFFAHGTLFRFIGFYIKTQERFRADTKVHFAAAAVYEEADTNGNAAFALDDIEHFPDTAARRYNIFHHKDTFPV